MWPLFALFIGGTLAILLLAHWAVYLTLSFFLQFKNFWLEIGIFLLPLIFIATSIIGSRFNYWLLNIFYYISSAWLGLFNFLVFSFVAVWLIYFAAKFFHLDFNGKIFILIAIGLSAAIFIYGLINANKPRLKTYEVSLPGLPESWQGKTAVWVSDLHLGHINKQSFARSVVEQIKKTNPDIVFVGGDLFDGLVGDLNYFAQPFADLKPPLGAYFITGNHEEFNSSERYLAAVKKVGLQPLVNEAIEIDGVILIGVNFRDGSNHDRLKKISSLVGANIRNGQIHERFKNAFAGLDKAKPMILLNHYPGNLDIAKESGVNLQLSGHSHRGQLWPYNYITSLLYHGYDYGFKQYDDMTVITSAGVGTWGPPIRVGADPDILIIKFK